MEKKFYQAKWFTWIFLIAFPPLGIFLLWHFQKDSKKVNKILLTILFSLVFLIYLFLMIPGDSTPKSVCLYDEKNIEIKDSMNGSGTEKIGEYSVIKVPSTDVTEETLTDWYYNYVEKTNYAYYIIIYSDMEALDITEDSVKMNSDGNFLKSIHYGVYSSNDYICKDALIEDYSKYGYMYGGASAKDKLMTSEQNNLKNEVLYYPNSESGLTVK